MSKGRKHTSDAGNRKKCFGALRDISASLEHARQTAYGGGSRKRVTFSAMTIFLDERRSERNAKAAVRVNESASYGRYWQHMLSHRPSEEKALTTASRERYYRSLVHEEDALLSTFCLHSIAQHVERLDCEDVHHALSTMSYSATQLFSLLCCLYDTMTDFMVPALRHEYLQKVYLSRKVSDTGVEALLSGFLTAGSTQYELLDSWEQIDPTEITTSTSMGLREIYLLSSNVSLSSIELIRDSCLHLEKLSLHDVEFCGEKEESNTVVICARFLEVISGGFSSLHTLELLCCSWTHVDALMLWARHLAQQRSMQMPTLPSLEVLVIAKSTDFIDSAHGKGKAAQWQDGQYAQLGKLLQDECGIALTVYA